MFGGDGLSLPKTRGRNCTKPRGRVNRYQTPSRGSYSHYPSAQDDASWRPVPSRGRGQQRGRGYHQPRSAPVPTYNSYAPLQGNWEEPQFSNHFLGQGRIPWREPPLYSPTWAEEWKDHPGPVQNGHFSLKIKN